MTIKKFSNYIQLIFFIMFTSLFVVSLTQLIFAYAEINTESFYLLLAKIGAILLPVIALGMLMRKNQEVQKEFANFMKQRRESRKANPFIIFHTTLLVIACLCILASLIGDKITDANGESIILILLECVGSGMLALLWTIGSFTIWKINDDELPAKHAAAIETAQQYYQPEQLEAKVNPSPFLQSVPIGNNTIRIFVYSVVIITLISSFLAPIALPLTIVDNVVKNHGIPEWILIISGMSMFLWVFAIFTQIFAVLFVFLVLSLACWDSSRSRFTLRMGPDQYPGRISGILELALIITFILISVIPFASYFFAKFLFKKARNIPYYRVFNL